jgi:hypothetical protein
MLLKEPSENKMVFVGPAIFQWENCYTLIGCGIV